MHFTEFRKLFFASTAALVVAWAGCSADSGGGGTAGGGGVGATGTGATGTGATGTGASGGATDGGGAGGTGSISFGATGGGGTGNTGGTAGDACAATIVNSQLVPANLLFVIDRSGSMNCNLPSDGQSTANCEAFPAPISTTKPTKWKLTRDALKQAITNLQSSPNIAAGMVVFPRPATECQVTSNPDVAVAALDASQGAALSSFLDGVSPAGKTPLAGATILSYAHLHSLLTSGAPIQGNLFVVLLTDGFETCTTGELPKLLSTDIPNSRLLNIRTFVIGVPGSEDGRSLLSEMAWQGGTEKSASCAHGSALPLSNVGDCHFDMTTSPNFAQDLQNALTQISGTVLSCEIDVPAAPPGKKINYNDVKVSVNDSPVPQDNSGTCDQANGWQFSADKTKIYLCGTACADAKKPSAKIALDLGCLTDVR